MERLDDLIKTVKAQEAVSVAKANEVLEALKTAEFLKKKEEEEKKCNTIAIVCGIVLGIVAVAAIAYALYLYFAPDCLDDFEDEYDDDYEPDFEDEFFEDDDKKDEE